MGVDRLRQPCRPPYRELEVMEAAPQKNWPSRGMICGCAPARG